MRVIIAAATVGLLIGGALVAVFVGWKLAVAAIAIDVVIAVAGLAVRAWRRGNSQANQIFDEEIGGIGPKDFAEDLRVHGDPTVYRTDDTEPGDNR